jgi:hypothetical protein
MAVPYYSSKLKGNESQSNNGVVALRKIILKNRRRFLVNLKIKIRCEIKYDSIEIYFNRKLLSSSIC